MIDLFKIFKMEKKKDSNSKDKTQESEAACCEPVKYELLVEMIKSGVETTVSCLRQKSVTNETAYEWGLYNEFRNAKRDKSYVHYISGDVTYLLLSINVRRTGQIRNVERRTLESAIEEAIEEKKELIDEYWVQYENEFAKIIEERNSYSNSYKDAKNDDKYLEGFSVKEEKASGL